MDSLLRILISQNLQANLDVGAMLALTSKMDEKLHLMQSVDITSLLVRASGRGNDVLGCTYHALQLWYGFGWYPSPNVMIKSEVPALRNRPLRTKGSSKYEPTKRKHWLEVISRTSL